VGIRVVDDVQQVAALDIEDDVLKPASAHSRVAQPVRLLLRGARPARALRSTRAPRAHPSSRTVRSRSLDVTRFMGRPVTLANGDCADCATGVTA
jgi:hypothetical protein